MAGLGTLGLLTETFSGILTFVKASSAILGSNVIGPLGLLGAKKIAAGTLLFFTPLGYMILMGSVISIGFGCFIYFIQNDNKKPSNSNKSRYSEDVNDESNKELINKEDLELPKNDYFYNKNFLYMKAN